MVQTFAQPRTPKYMLHEQMNPAPKMLGVVLVLVAMLALSVFFLKRFPVPVTMPLSQQTLTLSSGQQVQLILYANSRMNNHILESHATVLASALMQCRKVPWQQVYLSISHEKQMLNISMKGEENGHFKLRNLKASDVERHMGFFSQQWLAGVNLCE
ncbi:hypothetical protein JYB87_14365 [Shewanella avicenniae]|uniref:Orphan protein n=1 Tax=Shewanella avicenniae TaxID=2814294 RepID=A0ABX7QNT4_9GAMM|nr:hypothetical protein [Shewanella avicenniae]QSX32914.1 hypothetical protein JYB87_14365 [Shewanella avicenniae]